MPLELIYQDKDGKTVEWDTKEMIFNVDGVKMSPDFLISFVNSDGSKAIRVKRFDDECRVQAFDVETVKQLAQG